PARLVGRDRDAVLELLALAGKPAVRLELRADAHGPLRELLRGEVRRGPLVVPGEVRQDGEDVGRRLRDRGGPRGGAAHRRPPPLEDGQGYARRRRWANGPDGPCEAVPVSRWNAGWRRAAKATEATRARRETYDESGRELREGLLTDLRAAVERRF